MMKQKFVVSIPQDGFGVERAVMPRRTQPQPKKPVPKRRKKPKVSKGVIFISVILQILIASYLSCLIIFHGPFDNLKKMMVGTSMSSFHYTFFAKMFLSDAEIAKILNTSVADIHQNTGEVTVMNTTNNSIEEYNITGAKFKGYLLVVKNPLRVKIGCTKKMTVQGETTSEMAVDNSAVAAVNGGGFNDKSSNGKLWTGTGACPSGFLIVGGKIKYKDIGENVRSYIVGFDKQGKLLVGRRSIHDLMGLGVNDALQFDPVTYSPLLVVNGRPAFSGDGGAGITARTAIGQTRDGSVLLLVLDGRRLNMPGATLYDVQKIMLDYGAVNAANLDGGSSTTMYYNGEVINDPCDPLGERSVATAICVK